MTRRRPGRRPVRAAALALGLAAVALAGCTSAVQAGDATSGASSAVPVAPTTPATSSVPTPSATTAPPVPSSTAPSTPATSSATPTTPATPTAAPSTSPSVTVPARSSCTSLTIRVIRGSAAPGFEFAALQFVNTGSSACELVGVPKVKLFLNGAVIGTPAVPVRTSALNVQYRLTPGATAESRLKDFSNCNAPLSDVLKVVAPGSSISTKRPGQLRACRLVVYPLGPPS